MSFLAPLQLLTSLAQPQLVAWMLVLARVSGLFMSAPLFSTRDVPMRVRGFLAVTMSVLVWPMQAAQAGAAELPDNLVALGMALGIELLIGVTLGFGLMILFASLQLAGQLIGQMSGLTLGEVFDPNFDEASHIFSQFLYYVCMAVFVLIGGHRQMIAALLDSFATLPAGGGLPPQLLDAIVTLLTQSFALGIRVAGPVVVALLLSLVAMAIVGRTVPQLNVLVLGFSLNSLFALAILALTLGGAVVAFQEDLDATFETLGKALRATSG